LTLDKPLGDYIIKIEKPGGKKMTKKISWLLIGLLLIAGCATSTSTDTTTTTTTVTTTSTSGTTTTTSSTTTTTGVPALKVTNISPYALDPTAGASSALVRALVAADSALPASLEMNVTFSNFKVSSDGSTWQDLISSPMTINILDPSAMSSEGTSISDITPPTAGTYRFLGMGVSAIYLSMPGESDRNILSVLKMQDPTQDWNNQVMEILPFTYTSGDLRLNIYMPTSNISGTSYDDFFPSNGPLFNFSGGTVSTEGVGTVNLTIASGIDAGRSIFVGAFRNIMGDSGPSFNGVMTNAGDGSATGSMIVPPGSWYFMAIASDGAMGPTGPTEGSKSYTSGGALPWEGGLTPTAVGTGETVPLSLSYAFTISSTMGAGGSGRPPEGDSSIALTITPDSPITLAASTELMLYAYDSLIMSGPPTYFLNCKTLPPGLFSGTELLASNLSAGNYYIIAMLNISDQQPPLAGTDYVGFFGSMSPAGITLEASQNLNLTGTPIIIRLMAD
jgi:hypothetical protein